MVPSSHLHAPQTLALLSLLLTTHLAAACTNSDDSRDAFVGTFAFASSSFETDCSPVPPEHVEIDEVIEISLGDGDTLDVVIDGATVPCADVAQLGATPRRIGCELPGGSVSYQVDVWIDLSYERPSRMRLVKEFAAPDACSMTFSGLLTPAP